MELGSGRDLQGSAAMLARKLARRRTRWARPDENRRYRTFPGRVPGHDPERPKGTSTHHLDARSVSAAELVAALQEVGIGTDWIVAQQLRDYAAVHPNVPDFGLPSALRMENPNRAFRNLIVGTIAEELVHQQCLKPLLKAGYTIEDTRLKGDFTDYILHRGPERLPINVKVASTLFRNAKTAVGLEPTDCIPISTYKVVGSCDKEPNLLYVDVVDYRLRYRVDAFLDMMTGNEAIVWDLLSWYGGKGSKKAQDEFIASLFRTHGPELMKLVRGADIRVASAQKIRQIMTEKPERCPALSSRMASAAQVGDPSVHISVAKETVPWAEIAAVLTKDGIPGVLERVHKTSRVAVRRPSL